ncbi:DUF1566 domain-containing protein [Vibrio cholerae]|nr:DUF1566 domain-containing protein [Vibrio cholerae]EKF9422175.1 DUF1566 domain-containing protein [Vibrio cholerae]
MLFNRILISIAVALPLIACSDQPGKESNSPPAAGSTVPSLPPATGSGNGSGGTAGSGGTTGSSPTAPDPLTPPIATGPSSFTLSGPVVGSQKSDTYLFKICSGNVCDRWQSTVENGVFEYTFELSQWPQDKNVIIEGNKLDGSARTNTNPEINSKANSYFKTELDNLANLQKWDGNKDGVLNEKEVSKLSLDSVTMAYQTVANYLLANQLKHHAEKPYSEKHQAVRNYLSENSLNTLVTPTEEQLQKFKEHVNGLTAGWNKKFHGEYTMPFTPDQWLALGGKVETPLDQQVIRLNAAQMKTLFQQDNNREATNKQFRLTVQQSALIKGELVYNQQLVLELAALYNLLAGQPAIELTLSHWDSKKVTDQIKALNPGDGEATHFEGTYNIPLNADHLAQLGLYDSPSGKDATLLVNASTMRDVYQTSQLDIQQKKSGNYRFVVSPIHWPTAENNLLSIGANVLQKLGTNPSRPLWRHYRDHIVTEAPPVKVYTALEHDFNADLQQEYRFLHKVNELVMANHKHPLKSSILGLAPEKYLRISGRFPSELQSASFKIILGSRPTPKPGEYSDNGRYPERHNPVPLLAEDGQRKTTLDLKGQNGFVAKIALRDIDNHFTLCKPGKPYEGEYKHEYTADEMQDQLTIHIVDEKTGTELRSVLGSFCELAQLDKKIGNGNDILEISELERLNVGYVSTAQSVLLMKMSLSELGSNNYLHPWRHEQLVAMYRDMPRKQVELLAAVVALQAKGILLGRVINLIEGATFYEDLLALAGMNIYGEYGMLSDNNLLPSLETLQTNLNAKEPIGAILLSNLDVNISHMIQEITALLSTSKVDSYYFKHVRPGSWVTVYPVSSLDPTCQVKYNENQLFGIGVAGKGKNEQGHWMTVRWDAQIGANSYTIGWQTTPFSDISSAANQVSTKKLYTTLPALEAKGTYYIRIQSDVGEVSETLEYQPQRVFLADSRVTHGIVGDDSTRGRDSDPSCDPLSGKAKNSNSDGFLGARYIKLDEKGLPLKRQDLTYKQHPFQCVLDAQSGLVWETKRARKENQPYSIHDDDNMYAMAVSESTSDWGASCVLPELNITSSDPVQCNVANQVKWVNQAKLCGLDNWRVPSMLELYSLMDFGRKNRSEMKMDMRYFPLTRVPRTETLYNDKWQVIREGYTHGFWTTFQSLDQKKNSVFEPLWGTLQRRDIHEPHLLMLVSDGFKTEQQ